MLSSPEQSEEQEQPRGMSSGREAISNRVEIIDQITYLTFIQRLDDVKTPRIVWLGTNELTHKGQRIATGRRLVSPPRSHYRSFSPAAFVAEFFMASVCTLASVKDSLSDPPETCWLLLLAIPLFLLLSARWLSGIRL
jgi:hypothetical protein